MVLLTLFSCGISFALNVYSAGVLMNDVSGLMSMRWLKPCLSARDTRLTLGPRHGHGAYLAPAQWRLQQDARSQRGRDKGYEGYPDSGDEFAPKEPSVQKW